MTIAFTTDLSGHWSRDWIRWPALERFWGKVFDWLRPVKEALPPHEVRINLAKNQPVLELYLFEETTDQSVFRYSLSSKESKKEGTLQKLTPGHTNPLCQFSPRATIESTLLKSDRGKESLTHRLDIR